MEAIATLKIEFTRRPPPPPRQSRYKLGDAAFLIILQHAGVDQSGVFLPPDALQM